jgi:phosphomannomutase
MVPKLKAIVSLSGIRGIVGKSLYPDEVVNLARAFGSVYQGKIVIARDTRSSGRFYTACVTGGLLSAGCEVVDIGIVPTPTVEVMIEELNAQGGVVISASHNPPEWNALKFFDRTGLHLDEEGLKKVLKIYYHRKFRDVTWNGVKEVSQNAEAIKVHINRLLKEIPVKKIKKAHFKVVLDACNGAGYKITPLLLKKLGCEVVTLYTHPGEGFPHPPEPIKENAEEVCKLTRRVKADIGFLQDADADRVAVISEHGEFIGEEYSVALAVRAVLEKEKTPVVVNLSTSEIVSDIARQFNQPVIRTAVGERNVAQKMREVKSVIGGEGSGGVIYHRVAPARDSLSGIGLILSLLATTRKTVSELIQENRKYYQKKLKLEMERQKAQRIIKLLGKKYQKKGAESLFEDGVRISWGNTWAHIRPSNTEPVLRIIVETVSEKETQSLTKELLQEIKKFS